MALQARPACRPPAKDHAQRNIQNQVVRPGTLPFLGEDDFVYPSY